MKCFVFTFVYINACTFFLFPGHSLDIVYNFFLLWMEIFLFSILYSFNCLFYDIKNTYISMSLETSILENYGGVAKNNLLEKITVTIFKL